VSDVPTTRRRSTLSTCDTLLVGKSSSQYLKKLSGRSRPYITVLGLTPGLTITKKEHKEQNVISQKYIAMNKYYKTSLIYRRHVLHKILVLSFGASTSLGS
jgi:hypothetical protein